MPKKANNTSRDRRADRLHSERAVTAAAAKSLRLKNAGGGDKDKGEPTALTSAEHMPAELLKYWYSRHELFSEFDTAPGIQLDAQSWYSVTPEAIAVRCAHRCAMVNTQNVDEVPVILDAFCGAGGNAIAFARAGMRVIAMDLDEAKLRMCKHNASIYGVEEFITTIRGDFFDFARDANAASKSKAVSHHDGQNKWNGVERQKFNVVFLSPPWGGVNYLDAPATPVSAVTQPETFDYYAISSLCAPQGGRALVDAARRLSQNLVLYVPRSMSMLDLRSLAFAESQNMDESSDARVVDVEEQWIGHKLKALTAYYGELAEWQEEQDHTWGWKTADTSTRSGKKRKSRLTQ